MRRGDGRFFRERRIPFVREGTPFAPAVTRNTDRKEAGFTERDSRKAGAGSAIRLTAASGKPFSGKTGGPFVFDATPS
jgi:hypothetical protein